MARSGAVGYRRDRPGLKQLLRAVENGDVDMVVCEALDRLARDAEDVAWLGKKLAFHRVQLHTVSEGHVDEIKFAVAGLLGSIFLKHFIDKTLRGMEAAVLAGRFAGGGAYGYKRVVQLDVRGEPVRGLLAVDEREAEVVRRIFAWFAAGLSAIQIATRLNEEGVQGPRGGQWNASTIRGDPSKLVGILNNPLYAGRLVWGRRQWRKNPDSEKRERRYRLRDRSEWVEVAVPDLCIIDGALFEAARAEIERRRRAPATTSRRPAGAPDICCPASSGSAAAGRTTRSAARTITAAPARRRAAPAATRYRCGRNRSRRRRSRFCRTSC